MALRADVRRIVADGAPSQEVSTRHEAHRNVLVASLVCYVGLTALAGREVLAHLFTGVMHDLGDPLFTATVLDWNARTPPLSEAWWQFPAFHPTASTMAFSEHLLGISVLATPLTWLLGDAIAASNLVTLATFPLCALTMAALVYRTTGSPPGAFVAGLMFGFSPYRMGQLPHLQMLAVFWAPLALLGLHGYVDSGRVRWLVLFGVAFVLQGMSNLYYLLFLSVLVALWVLWFAAARGVRVLAPIVGTAIVGCAAMLPILLGYRAVHLHEGFSRSLWEVQHYSADLAALACAPPDLVLWGWLRMACRPEGELFPGLAAASVLVLGAWFLTRDGGRDTSRRWQRVVAWVHVAALCVATVFAMVAVSAVVAGPWRLDVGVLHASVGSAAKPVVTGLAAAAVAALTSRGLWEAVRTQSMLGFYLVAGVVMWLVSLGPTLWVSGVTRNTLGLLPFGWLMLVPGVDGVRVPARAWMMVTLCLAMVGGLVVSRIAGSRRGLVAVGVLTLLVLGDGWAPPFESVAVVRQAPSPETLRGRLVLTLPIGALSDIVAQYEAVRGGWRSVNGYSGYEPAYYDALRHASAAEQPGLFESLRRLDDLYVIVPRDEQRLRAFVMRQDGVTTVAESRFATQFVLPRLPAGRRVATGTRRRVQSLVASCSNSLAHLAVDGDRRTQWDCERQLGHEVLTADLGRVSTVGVVGLSLGTSGTNFPRELAIDVSVDGRAWQRVWQGDVVGQMMTAAFESPTTVPLAVSFTPTGGRYVRVAQIGMALDRPWSVVEFEIWAGADGGG